MKQEQVRKIRAEQFGFIFQASHLVPFLTVEEQLMLMLDVSGSKLKKTERKQEIDRLLKLVGMDQRKNAYPSSLSGGEKQRRSEEHTSELQSRGHLVCRLLLEKTSTH